jgi:hypothetical protein
MREFTVVLDFHTVIRGKSRPSALRGAGILPASFLAFILVTLADNGLFKSNHGRCGSITLLVCLPSGRY